MTEYRPEYWEIPVEAAKLDRLPATCALWFETEDDRERRHALREFFQEVAPSVRGLIESELTRRQREVVLLYFYYGKTQEDIAVILDLSQSTVSRHLFGTARGGRKVGGALPKLRKAIGLRSDPAIAEALGTLRERLSA